MIVQVDYKKLESAIKKNPEKVRQGALRFMRDSIHTYRRIIKNTAPWKMDSIGGGVPKLSGNLQKAHIEEITPFESKIYVNEAKAPYAKWIAQGTGEYVGHKKYLANIKGVGYRWMKGMPPRPWMKFAKMAGQRQVEQLEKKFLIEIVDNLAKQ